MESPVLCKKCQQWLCASRDTFCACCGAGLVIARFSTDRLLLDNHNPAELTISNHGVFQLYWAAEIVAPEPGVGALFSITPDYGVIAPGDKERVTINLVTKDRTSVRAHLEIASNDSQKPEVKIAIAMSREA